MQDNRVQPSAGWCSPGQCRAVQDGAGVMVQEDTAQHSVAQHSTALGFTPATTGRQNFSAARSAGGGASEPGGVATGTKAWSQRWRGLRLGAWLKGWGRGFQRQGAGLRGCRAGL